MSAALATATMASVAPVAIRIFTKVLLLNIRSNKQSDLHALPSNARQP